jgi:hemerythrin-like domain-containing protein
MTCKCIEALMAEHEIIVRIADVMEAMANGIQVRAEYDEGEVGGALQILRSFGDDFHQAKEEGALFPVFTNVCDVSQQTAIRHMLLEHEQDRSLMTGMQDAISRSNTAQVSEYLLRLANTLRNHVSRENSILFEAISAQLNDEDDAKVIAELESFDREFETQKAELLRRLRLLEWKYSQKTTS